MPRSEAHEARNAAVREGFRSVKDARAASVPTADAIVSTCETLKVAHKVEDVPDSQGARLHWIGDASPRNTILYFHGGGLGLPAIPGHIIFLVQSQQKLAADGKPFSIAFLEYGLTPEIKFPVQHMQAVQSLKYLIQSGRKASEIIISGDSAGGNLALGVLSATRHSREGIPSLNLDTNLRGAALISPWVCLNSKSASVQQNQDKDIVTAAIQDGLREELITPSETDEFAEAIRAPTEWWTGTPVDSILCLAGSDEIFRDDIVTTAGVLRKAGLRVESVVCRDQIHVDCILDAQSGLEVGDMSHAYWV
ncbi:hypothetical protein B0A52_05878 [Exophiala mesophila]|uniref:Alpha/beta hydrolase fold-3 domain-containing protein n=1 Tax=Exophiala mesophila TaxID=212818 RepID=A0A438N3Q7_EXOME|nr:hypothetical protein B0A52_05878 [Exophiala mesophila]